MKTTAINELVAVRQRKCAKQHICVDTELGLAKGYTKAKFFRSQKAPPYTNNPARVFILDNETKTNTSFTLQDNSHSQAGLTSIQPKPKTKSSPSLHGILKELGVDYVGYY